MTEDAADVVGAEQQAGSEEAKPSPVWTLTALLFLILLLIALASSLYELWWGTAEDKQLSKDVKEALTIAQDSLDRWDAEMRVKILASFPRPERESLSKRLDALGERGRTEQDNKKAGDWLDRREGLLKLAQKLLADEYLTSTERTEFVRALEEAESPGIGSKLGDGRSNR